MRLVLALALLAAATAQKVPGGCRSTIVAAVDGVNSKLANGKAILSRKTKPSFIRFPNGKGGNFKNGNIKYAFYCSKSTTVNFQAMTIGATGTDDSLLIDVDMKGSTVNKNTGTWHTGGTGAGSLKTMTFRPSKVSKSFKVGKGSHTLHISEREDGIYVSQFGISKGAGNCRFVVKCPTAPRCRNTEISAVEGHNSGIASGMAIKHVAARVPYVDFPDRCPKGKSGACSKGNFGHGYLSYPFVCTKPTTVSFKARTIANSGTSDSLLIDVNIAKDTVALKQGKAQTWHHGSACHPPEFSPPRLVLPRPHPTTSSLRPHFAAAERPSHPCT
jgi:predicted nucleic-acid-binding Zn-ribbon protein